MDPQTAHPPDIAPSGKRSLGQGTVSAGVLTRPMATTALPILPSPSTTNLAVLAPSTRHWQQTMVHLHTTHLRITTDLASLMQTRPLPLPRTSVISQVRSPRDMCNISITELRLTTVCPGLLVTRHTRHNTIDGPATIPTRRQRLMLMPMSERSPRTHTMLRHLASSPTGLTPLTYNPSHTTATLSSHNLESIRIRSTGSVEEIFPKRLHLFSRNGSKITESLRTLPRTRN